jgi:hypothetical protein
MFDALPNFLDTGKMRVRYLFTVIKKSTYLEGVLNFLEMDELGVRFLFTNISI